MHFAAANSDHQPKPQIIVSLGPMNLKKTCGVDSEAITVFQTELQRLMAQKSINHEVSRAESVFLGVPSLLFCDLLLVWPFAECW